MRRIASSSHSGLGEWLIQRISALYLLGFLLWLTLMLRGANLQDFNQWQAWFSGLYVRIAFALFFLSALSHAWVGMRSVFMDYLKPFWLKLTMNVFLFLGVMALGFWAMKLVFGVGP